MNKAGATVGRSPFLLLMPGLWAIRHRFKLATPRAVLLRMPFVAIALGFWGLLYWGTHIVVGFVAGIEGLGPMLVARLVGLMFFSLMGFLILSNLITAITQFYLSSDLQLLRTLPLPDSAVLVQKSVYCILNSSWMVALFLPPVLIAFGTATGAGAVYYATVFPAFALFMLICAGVGMASAHVLTWLFPAGRLRDVLLLAGLVLFLLAYLFMRSLVPADLENPVEVINRLLAFRADSPLLPSYWITRSTVPPLVGRAIPLLYPALLAVNAAFIMMLSHAVGMRMFGLNLERMRPSGGVRLRAGGGYYPSRAMALLYKDMKVFVRDKAQWSQLLIILALVFVYVYNFRLVPIDAVTALAPFVREVIVLLNLLMAGMVLAAVAARFVYTSVSAEGMAFWVVQSAPVRMSRFLLEKLLYGALPITVLTLAIVVMTNITLGVGAGTMALSTLVVLVLSVSICALGTGLGAMNPRFKYENIVSVSMSMGSMAFMLMAFFLVVATLALVAWPVYLYHARGAVHLPATIAAAALVLGLNFAAAYVPMRMGIRKLSYNILL